MRSLFVLLLSGLSAVSLHKRHRSSALDLGDDSVDQLSEEVAALEDKYDAMENKHRAQRPLHKPTFRASISPVNSKHA